MGATTANANFRKFYCQPIKIRALNYIFVIYNTGDKNSFIRQSRYGLNISSDYSKLAMLVISTPFSRREYEQCFLMYRNIHLITMCIFFCSGTFVGTHLRVFSCLSFVTSRIFMKYTYICLIHISFADEQNQFSTLYSCTCFRLIPLHFPSFSLSHTLFFSILCLPHIFRIIFHTMFINI